MTSNHIPVSLRTNECHNICCAHARQWLKNVCPIALSFIINISCRSVPSWCLLRHTSTFIFDKMSLTLMSTGHTYIIYHDRYTCTSVFSFNNWEFAHTQSGEMSCATIAARTVLCSYLSFVIIVVTNYDSKYIYVFKYKESNCRLLPKRIWTVKLHRQISS